MLSQQAGGDFVQRGGCLSMECGMVSNIFLGKNVAQRRQQVRIRRGWSVGHRTLCQCRPSRLAASFLFVSSSPRSLHSLLCFLASTRTSLSFSHSYSHSHSTLITTPTPLHSLIPLVDCVSITLSLPPSLPDDEPLLIVRFPFPSPPVPIVPLSLTLLVSWLTTALFNRPLYSFMLL